MRAPRLVGRVLALSVVAACAADDPFDEPLATASAAVAVPLTNVETMVTPNWYSRYDQFEMMNATAFAHTFTRERYVVASRRKGAPYQLEFFLIDGQQANATFGKAITGIQQPLCGPTSC